MITGTCPVFSPFCCATRVIIIGLVFYGDLAFIMSRGGALHFFWTVRYIASGSLFIYGGGDHPGS